MTLKQVLVNQKVELSPKQAKSVGYPEVNRQEAAFRGGRELARRRARPVDRPTAKP